MCTTSSTSTHAGEGIPALGAWVQRHTERTRDGRHLVVLVNRRDRVALSLTDGEEAALRGRIGGHGRPGPAAGETETEGLLADLRVGGFLAGSAPAPTPSPARRAATALAELQVRWRRGDRLVQALHRRGGALLFDRRTLPLQVLVGLLGVLVIAHWVRRADEVSYRVGPGALVWVLVLSAAAITVHELAHGLGIARAGRHVDAIGAGLHLGSPVCFVEAVEGLTMTRRQRVVQAAAGPWTEWLFTSVAALLLLVVPDGTAETVLHRFVVVNAFVVTTNLLPFVGLDGYLLLADLVGMPDLAARSAGAPGRVAAALLAGRRPGRTEWLLAAYRVANGVVALALLVTSVVMWIALFGPSVGDLLAAGPVGWLALTALTLLLGRPVVRSSGPRVLAALDAAVDLAARVRFRSEWGWRVAATEALAAMPPYSGHDETALGRLAGLLRRVPARKVEVVVTGGLVQRGRVAWDGRVLGPGEVLPPGARPVALTRRALLVLAQDRDGLDLVGAHA